MQVLCIIQLQFGISYLMPHFRILNQNLVSFYCLIFFVSQLIIKQIQGFSYLLETRMKNKQNPSSPFSESKTEDLLSTSLDKFNPNTCDYLKEVQYFSTQAKRIQKNAKQTSNTINLQFRKYSNKPEMSTVYVDSANVSKKLQQMNTRVNVNKYEMIIEVKKDAIDNLATKKPAVKDQIQDEKYECIYKKFLKDEFTGKPLQITNPTIRLYQFYDEQDKDWRQNLKNKGLICRQIVKQTQQKILQSRSRKDDQSMSDSQITPEILNNVNYDEMFDEIVENNEIFAQKKLPVLNPQTIVLDRFQTKFYKCREKKFEHVYSRVNEDTKQSIHSFSVNSELNTPEKNLKNRKINLKIPQSCKQVYNTQNKLLVENMNNGLSKDHTKKLIAQFNKTILDMKADGEQQKNEKKTAYSLNKIQKMKEPKLFKQLQKIREVSTSHTKNFRLKKKPFFKNLSVNQMN